MIITPHASFTRPANATQYAAGDLISNSLNGAEFLPLKFNIARLSGSGGAIKAIRLFKDDETTTDASFILNLFSIDPSLNIADNAAFALTDTRHFVADIPCDMATGAVAGTDGNLFKRFELSNPVLIDPKAYSGQGPSLFGVLEANDTYTPASGELFEVTLEISDTL